MWCGSLIPYCICVIRCSSSSLAGQRRRGGATAEQQVPHLVHLITSNKPTARSGDVRREREGGRKGGGREGGGREGGGRERGWDRGREGG